MCAKTPGRKKIYISGSLNFRSQFVSLMEKKTNGLSGPREYSSMQHAACRPAGLYLSATVGSMA